MLSLVALPLAVLSEALSLYGVADDRQSTLITVTVTVGLALGGAILIVPLYAGWIRLMWGRSWLR
jgi:predicted aconitase with swiveling domain